MSNEPLWRLGFVFFITGFMFIVNALVSLYYYKLTEGRIYLLFQKVPKRFVLAAFIMSFIFAVLSVLPDGLNLLLAPIMIKPVNTKDTITYSLIQFFLIVILGTPLVWLSSRMVLPLAHKLFQDQSDRSNLN